MLYWILRWIAMTGLRWYYRDIRVMGSPIPEEGPVIFAVNHPNALVDALVAGSVVRRRIRLTGKATLFERPVLAAFLRRAGVVPLQRLSDARRKPEPDGTRRPSPVRNAESFRALADVLAAGGAILIFPEGRSHDEPSIAPLRTGTARIALEARDARGVRGLRIVPLGLIFERKDRPRSRIVVQAGEPIAMDRFEGGSKPVEALTARIEQGLRDVTLNFESPELAERVLSVAGVMSAVVEPVRPLGEADPPLTSLVETVRRIERARLSLDADDVSEALRARADAFVTRLDAFGEDLRRHELLASDVGIRTGLLDGVRFALREVAILAVVGPAAAWGRVNHWLPLRSARLVALQRGGDRDQPAMRTLVAGTIFVLFAYVAQTTAVAAVAGPRLAFAYVITLPLFASWDFRLTDRTRRAFARVRAYLLLRRHPSLHERLAAESEALRTEGHELESLLAGRVAPALTR